MKQDYANLALRTLIARGFQVDRGLTPHEFLRIEDAAGVDFPADLRAFLMAGLPVSKNEMGFPNWRQATSIEIERWLASPFESIEFDVENNAFWLDAWGPRPGEKALAKSVARGHLHEVPRLIPVFGHRFIPSRPLAEGNPVFSVVQSDVIVYGNDIADYLFREFKVPRPSWSRTSAAQIEFWSSLAEA